MMASDTAQLLSYIIAAAQKEGCLIIEPRMEAFQTKVRPFLEGMRHVPASINRPPGREMFGDIMREPGRGHWLMIWIPE